VEAFLGGLMSSCMLREASELPKSNHRVALPSGQFSDGYCVTSASSEPFAGRGECSRCKSEGPAHPSFLQTFRTATA